MPIKPLLFESVTVGLGYLGGKGIYKTPKGFECERDILGYEWMKVVPKIIKFEHIDGGSKRAFTFEFYKKKPNGILLYMNTVQNSVEGIAIDNSTLKLDIFDVHNNTNHNSQERCQYDL